MTARVLVVTLGILALTTSASAECAWVLWNRSMLGGKAAQWYQLRRILRRANA